MQIEYRLQKSLDQRIADNSIRSLKHRKKLLDFFSNDYLGLSQSQELFDIINKKHLENPSNGSTGSRLLSGNTAHCEQVEEQLANIFSSEKALIFNSGYTANLALISSIPQKGDTIIYDELAHACIKDGARLSLANRYSFKHNNLQDLEQKISRSKGEIFVVVESIYSMDGDQCPLKELVDLSKKHGFNIILDEAHATGIYGPLGNGLSGQLGMGKDIFARVFTFGKAMGIHGAAIAGSDTLIKYLINYARPFIYTTALPAHSIVAIESSFSYLSSHLDLQNIAQQKVNLFNNLYDQKLAHKFLKTKSNHPIQSILIPGNDAVKNVTTQLTNQGLDVRPILSPTVKKGQERLRVCLHTYNTDNDISSLIDTLAAAK